MIYIELELPVLKPARHSCRPARVAAASKLRGLRILKQMPIVGALASEDPQAGGGPWNSRTRRTCALGVAEVFLSVLRLGPICNGFRALRLIARGQR